MKFDPFALGLGQAQVDQTCYKVAPHIQPGYTQSITSFCPIFIAGTFDVVTQFILTDMTFTYASVVLLTISFGKLKQIMEKYSERTLACIFV